MDVPFSHKSWPILRLLFPLSTFSSTKKPSSHGKARLCLVFHTTTKTTNPTGMLEVLVLVIFFHFFLGCVCVNQFLLFSYGNGLDIIIYFFIKHMGVCWMQDILLANVKSIKISQKWLCLQECPHCGRVKTTLWLRGQVYLGRDGRVMRVNHWVWSRQWLLSAFPCISKRRVFVLVL